MVKLLQFIIIINCVIVVVYCDGWSPAGNRLKTRWTSKVNTNRVWPEYPRPQLRRENNWIILNGLWSYSITSIGTTVEPTKYDGEILVPFPIESSLSGVQTLVYPNQTLWYYKSFNMPRKTTDELIIIHFGAVDYHTKLYLNGQSVGEHIGGYDSFSFDITKYITSSKDQSLVLRVTDLTGGTQPIGKQSLKPGGIHYTSSTGIWQTVWLEIVPNQYITSIKITPDIDSNSIQLAIKTNTPNDHSKTAYIKILDIDMKEVAVYEKYGINTDGSKIIINNPIYWSTTNPYLYTIQITYNTDFITSYFGMRKIEVKRDGNGNIRSFLNNKPIFMFSVYDQGYWPDGVYLAPNEEALKYDIELAKQLGFNCIKKHDKVEPERWYYWTDKMGILVWQDFPYSYDNPFDNRKQIEYEMERMVTKLYNHPSIVMWVLFTDAWTEFETFNIRNWDQSRLINEARGPSRGWPNRNDSNVFDHHSMPYPKEIPQDSHRLTNTKYGSAGLKIDNHMWDNRKSSYVKAVNNRAELQKFFIDRLATVRALTIFGLGSSVYFQITDTETEINGLVTYDREVIKVNVSVIRKYVEKLYPFQTLSSVILKSGHLSAKQEWHYTTRKPNGNWMKPSYNSIRWRIGKVGFGTEGTPAITIHTDWNKPDIWLRKEFDISTGKLPKHPVLHIFYDEYASVYINGIEILANILNPYQVGYAAFDIEPSILKEGKNIIAIHCHNVYGGQGIDAGIIDITATDTLMSSTDVSTVPSRIRSTPYWKREQ